MNKYIHTNTFLIRVTVNYFLNEIYLNVVTVMESIVHKASTIFFMPG